MLAVNMVRAAHNRPASWRVRRSQRRGGPGASWRCALRRIGKWSSASSGRPAGAAV